VNSEWFKLALSYVHERKSKLEFHEMFSATPNNTIMFLSLFNDSVLIADFN